LRVVHNQVVAAIQEEITRSWVSEHFTFDLPNCNTICEHCSYSGKIYDGIDVLINHLQDRHDLDGPFNLRI